MKKVFLSITMFVILSVAITSCTEKEVEDALSSGDSSYSLDTKQFSGTTVRNKTLKAIEVGAGNTNMLRIYYSDSAALLGFPAKLKIVSSGRAGHLHYDEVYIEVNTTATDTYLSTGTDNTFVTVLSTGNTGRAFFNFTQVAVQHFTYTPLNEYAKISANLSLIQ